MLRMLGFKPNYFDLIRAGKYKEISTLLKETELDRTKVLPNKKNQTPFEFALSLIEARVSNVEDIWKCIDAILSKHPIIETAAIRGKLLLAAAKYNQVEIISKLVMTDALLDAKDPVNDYGLAHWAVEHENLELLQTLSSKKENGFRIISENGYPPLILAAVRGKNKVLERFNLESTSPSKDDINNNNNNIILDLESDGFTDKESSNSKENPQIDAFITVTAEELNEALFYAVASDRVDSVEILLKKGAKPTYSTKEGNSCLHWAIANEYKNLNNPVKNQHRILEMLLKASTEKDWFVLNKKKLTPLALACKYHRWDSASKLIHAYGNALTPENLVSHNLAFVEAVQAKQFKIAQYFLDHGVEIDACDLSENTCLHLAAKSEGGMEALQFAINNKADMTKVNDKGQTPIEIASLYKNWEHLKALLAYMPDKNIALNTALKVGDRAEIIKLLLQNGADPSAKDENGNTAYDLARKLNRKQCLVVLGQVQFRSRMKQFHETSREQAELKIDSLNSPHNSSLTGEALVEALTEINKKYHAYFDYRLRELKSSLDPVQDDLNSLENILKPQCDFTQLKLSANLNDESNIAYVEFKKKEKEWVDVVGEYLKILRKEVWLFSFLIKKSSISREWVDGIPSHIMKLKKILHGKINWNSQAEILDVFASVTSTLSNVYDYVNNDRHFSTMAFYQRHKTLIEGLVLGVNADVLTSEVELVTKFEQEKNSLRNVRSKLDDKSSADVLLKLSMVSNDNKNSKILSITHNPEDALSLKNT